MFEPAAEMFTYLLLMDDHGEDPNPRMLEFLVAADDNDITMLVYTLAGTLRDFYDAAGAPVDSPDRIEDVARRRALLIER